MEIVLLDMILNSYLDHLISEQSKRFRLLRRVYWVIGTIFVCSSVVFFLYETQYIWFIPLIVSTLIVVKVGMAGMEFDPEEPDGGDNKAKANGCLFLIAISIMGVIALSLLGSSMLATENWELSIGYLAITGTCAWISLEARKFTAKRYPSIWQLEYECGICESKMFRGEQYHCPACDFVSTSKKRHGLRQHFKKAHPDLDQQINLFGKVCSNCLKRDQGK